MDTWSLELGLGCRGDKEGSAWHEEEKQRGVWLTQGCDQAHWAWHRELGIIPEACSSQGVGVLGEV